MQTISRIANAGNAFPYYGVIKEVKLDSVLTEFDEEILEVISVYQPIMTKHIASQLALNYKFTYSIKEINSRLVEALSKYLTHDEFFRWSLRYEGMGSPG